ncbi:FliO/MopB family protein [Tepidicella baoligensis]|uniref:FliO/MopB family protein n=1 Tax=Tepidicella baoligensis TaxID=2707016 RepID=UPI0015D9D759|nr:flagellar biosynthetic protein FliO [Tepidicella baoligensis]
MTPSFTAFAPALGLLLLMGLLAWGVQWIKKRTAPVGTGQGAQLRVVSQLMVGPQQRVVVVELDGPEGPVQLTLGVTPQTVNTLHTQSVPVGTSYRQVAQALETGHRHGESRP